MLAVIQFSWVFENLAILNCLKNSFHVKNFTAERFTTPENQQEISLKEVSSQVGSGVEAEIKSKNLVKIGKQRHTKAGAANGDLETADQILKKNHKIL